MYSALKDARLYIYKENEKNKDENDYIRKAEDAKDNQLAEDISSHNWSNNPIDYV